MRYPLQHSRQARLDSPLPPNEISESLSETRQTSFISALQRRQLGGCELASAVWLIVMASVCDAQSIQLPNAPYSGSSDEISSSTGTRCRQSNGADTNLELGTVVDDRGSGAVYGRISIPLGPVPKRLDCSRVLELEIERLQMELQEMRDMAFEQ